MNRFFIDQPLSGRDVISLPSAIAHHVFRVLRQKPGDIIHVWNGDGRQWNARLEGTEKSAKALVYESTCPSLELTVPIYILQALPEGNKMDWILEKCTEAGAAGFFPITAQRSVIKLNPERTEKRMFHWEQVVIAACNQSGRCIRPSLTAPQSLLSGIQTSQQRSESWLGLWLDPLAGQSFDNAEHLQNLADGQRLPLYDAVFIAIGPEGGWTAQENRQACDAGFIPIKMSPRIYRTETAGLVALSRITAFAKLEPWATIEMPIF